MLIWADFPSGQRGLYGTNTSRMLNGVWAEVGYNAGFLDLLTTDPDPTIGDAGVVFNYSTNGPGTGVVAVGGRFVVPTEVDTLGIGHRLWLSQLPTNATYWPVIQVRNSSNAGIAYIVVTTTGQISAYSGGTINVQNGTLLGTSSPCIVANAYNHIEFKTTIGASTGAIQVRVNGLTVLNLTGLSLGTAQIAQFFIGGTDNGGSPSPTVQCYTKDLVVWDGTGSQGNDFFGNVAVYDIVPDSDVSLNWDPSIGSTGYNLIRDDKPAGTLTASGLISDGNVVRIDNTYYRLSSGSLDTGSPAGTSANPWKVLIGADNAATLLNLYKAIGATGVAGTTYSTALTAHTSVDANGVSDTQLSVTAKLSTAASIVTTETGSFLAWEAGTLTDGPTTPSYISADNSPPAASVFTMTDLPPDVIAVKGVIPVGRMVKSDGGDCTVLMSVSPNNVDYDDGTDRPITVASTYWWDISMLSPDTGSAWTPTEVNDMRFKIDRTT